MWARINFAWRLCGTAWSFVLFGLGGIAVTVVAVPILRCLPEDELSRARRTQRLFHRLFQLYINMMRFLGVLSYEIKNAEKLKNARLVLANHPSLLDVVFLISLLPNANCIVKGHLTRNIFVRGPVKAAGYIVNETAEDAIADAERVFSNKQCLIIFPEGTRTTPSEALKLKRGAANVAIRTGSDITPVLIYCDPTTLTKNERWYQIPPKRMHYRILVRNQIPIEQYSTTMNPSKGARKLTRDLTEYFEQELRAHG